MKHIITIITLILLVALTACKSTDTPIETTEATTTTLPTIDEISTHTTGQLTVSFNYEKISGWASNQFAVWIEDTDGNYINTLYATRWTADGGYKTRPDSIKVWVSSSGLSEMEKSEVDAISGATPKAGNLSYSWDLTDFSGTPVKQGEYVFFVEGTLRWKNYVIYSGVIEIGNEPVSVTAEKEFFFEGTNESYEPNALTEDSPENSMISGVVAVFEPN
ncbi:MAG: DUF2271 domain-containing protein [Oscillospiraceae bacterium]|nr:DUF2271 domain-containing protein [Oscillospiraceae bacterium]